MCIRDSHQAIQRRDAHGGIHTLAIHAGAQGRAVAQVADDDLAACRQFQKFNGPRGDIAVRSAVKAVLADVQVGIVFIGDGIAECLGRHCLMECRVEYGHLGHVGQQMCIRDSL